MSVRENCGPQVRPQMPRSARSCRPHATTGWKLPRGLCPGRLVSRVAALGQSARGVRSHGNRLRYSARQALSEVGLRPGAARRDLWTRPMKSTTACARRRWVGPGAAWLGRARSHCAAAPGGRLARESGRSCERLRCPRQAPSLGLEPERHLQASPLGPGEGAWGTCRSASLCWPRAQGPAGGKALQPLR